MKTIYLRMPDGKEELETGAVVTRAHLENIGHKIVRNKTKDYDVVLCWGCSMHDALVKRVPSLNGKVNSFNKLQALERFQKEEIVTPTIVSCYDKKRDLYPPRMGPWFGRNISHAKGKDIVVLKTWQDAFEDTSREFYSLYVPHERELRVWVFQGKALAVYQKHYLKPGLDNYKNMEYRSELREDLLAVKRLTKSAVLAVETLHMDFGAVDVLEGTDGRYYVLEVNSMPDISSMIRVSGIRLADSISKWAEAQ
jgi:glutathione synthase/RimK-type ligase-like ATP-grasp enzyme